MYKIIYKIKGSIDYKKTVILADNHLGMQKYIDDHQIEVGLKIIKYWGHLLFFQKRGIVVYDMHLRTATSSMEAKKLLAYSGSHPIILIAHTSFEQTTIYEENYAEKFKTIHLEDI